MSEDAELRREIARVARRLYERKLISALAGNVSARPRGASYFWITPSGVFKGELSEVSLIKVDLEGSILEGSLRPSIEWRMHALIYKRREDVSAVVHAHNPVATALSALGEGVFAEVEESILVGKVAVVPPAPPGSLELAEMVADAIAERRASLVVLQRHGVVAIGESPLEAEARVEALEEAAVSLALEILLRSATGLRRPPERGQR